MNLFYVLVMVSNVGSNFRENLCLFYLLLFSVKARQVEQNRGVGCFIMCKQYQVYGKRVFSC